MELDLVETRISGGSTVRVGKEVNARASDATLDAEALRRVDEALGGARLG